MGDTYTQTIDEFELKQIRARFLKMLEREQTQFVSTKSDCAPSQYRSNRKQRRAAAAKARKKINK